MDELDIRDYFAAKFCSLFVSDEMRWFRSDENTSDEDEDETIKAATRRAYMMADAMLVERAK